MIHITGGSLKNTPLHIPKPESGVRVLSSRVREAVISMLLPKLHQAVVWDLFAGSGSFGIETLSRKAERVIFFEKQGPSLKILRQNLKHISQRDPQAQFQIITCDLMHSALKKLRYPSLKAQPHVLFADPPYTLTIKWLRYYLRQQDILPLPEGVMVIKASLYDQDKMVPMITASPYLDMDSPRRYGDHLIYPLYPS